ncbi:MAG: HAMP domain-containing sensor histidine kinase [Terriglobales bacterium]
MLPGQNVRMITRNQKLELSNSDTDHLRVADALQAVCKSFAEKLRDARIELVQSYDYDAVVAADPGEFRQVLTCLISNAIDAMPNGGSLHLEIHSDGKVVQIVIADTGQGILPDTRPYIFQPFYTTKGDNGVGIGLWIARGIVEKAGGSIELENLGAQSRCGARFLIQLPAANARLHTLEERGAA